MQTAFGAELDTTNYQHFGPEMSNESVKTQLQECWRTFDTLVDSQSGGNEAIIRAMDIFAGGRQY